MFALGAPSGRYTFFQESAGSLFYILQASASMSPQEDIYPNHRIEPASLSPGTESSPFPCPAASLSTVLVISQVMYLFVMLVVSWLPPSLEGKLLRTGTFVIVTAVSHAPRIVSRTAGAR